MQSLSAKVPTWSSKAANPINEFVPEAEQAYKIESEEAQLLAVAREERLAKLSTMAGKERTL